MRRIDVTGRDPTSSSRVKYEKKRPPVTIGAYSHINTISAPVTAPDPESYGRLTEPSFVKKSLQEEIDDSIAYGHTPPKAPSSAGTAPFSFAQAVTASLIPPRAPRAMTSMDSMNTQATSNFPALSSISNNSKMSTPSATEDTLKAGAVSKNEEPTKQVLSMGARRQSAEGALNASARPFQPGGSAPSAWGNKAVQTPIPLFANAASPTNDPSPPFSHQNFSQQNTAEQHTAKVIGASYASPPRSFQIGSPPSNQKSHKSRRYTNETDGSSLIHKDDSEETKQKYETIMARLDDVFDAEEWDEDFLGPVNNSPELATEPQRVTYTTVGSVAKTNTVQTFSPPVRIQREGANRRMPILPTMRAADSFYARQQSMGGPGFAMPALNSYTGQHNQQQQQQQMASQTDINMSLLESLNLNLTDQEQEVLGNFNQSPTVMRSGNIQSPPRAPPMGSFMVENQLAAQGFAKEESYSQTSSLTGSAGLAGLNKMQTLQRLAQFENPAQGFAKERLAEFTAVKMQQQTENDPGLGGQTSRFDFNDMQRRTSAGAMSQYRTENDNPFSSGRRPSHDAPYQNSQYRGSVPPGYPQPLTAGPPGQRQNTVSVSRLNWVNDQNSIHNAHPDLPYVTRGTTDAPWFKDGFVGYNTHRSDTFRSIPSEDSYIRDTASAVDIQQYYPAGFPSGFHMRKTRTMNEVEKQKNLLPKDEFKAMEKDLIAEMKNNQWYGHLRRFGMTVEDHLNDFEMREKPHQPGPIQRPTAEFLAARKALLTSNVEKMALPDITEPLVAAAFGTLLAYSDNIVRPENRKLMSKFEPSPPWQLDNTVEGRKSVMNDDWYEDPPKRFGRDRRYQPSPLNEVWGNNNGNGDGNASVISKSHFS